LFGFPSRLQVIRHAVAVLGLERIKALAITVAMRGFMDEGDPLIRQCWQHSAACAVIAEEISPVFGITPQTAYSAGLLHDIGRHGLLKSYPAEYSPVLTKPYDSMKDMLAAERTAFNVEHGVAGAWLVKSWSLPRGFVDTCERHHEKITSRDPELLQVVKTACRMADAIGFSAVQCNATLTYDDVIWHLPPEVPRDMFPAGADLQENVQGRLKVFS
jgi:putative nucleotidyltransferase with HDIG domain